MRARLSFSLAHKMGYELRATGANPTAAEYGGISIRKQIIIAMTISGSLAGMVGINEVLGNRYRTTMVFPPATDLPGLRWRCWGAIIRWEFCYPRILLAC